MIKINTIPSDKLPVVVTVSGKAGSGKDTFAEKLSSELIGAGRSVLIMHFADLLKYILKAYFSWDGKKDEHGRDLLQTVGTDIIRKADENFFARFVLEFLLILGVNWDYVIIPDARFENEIQAMKDRFNTTTIVLSRDSYCTSMTNKALDHESEHGLDGYHFDITIHDEKLESLYNSASSIAAYLITRENDLNKNESNGGDL